MGKKGKKFFGPMIKAKRVAPIIKPKSTKIGIRG
jgi:hypothetical protein